MTESTTTTTIEGPKKFIMTIGGASNCGNSTAVNLLSLDESNPVPECLQNLGELPVDWLGHAGATLGSGERSPNT